MMALDETSRARGGSLLGRSDEARGTRSPTVFACLVIGWLTLGGLDLALALPKEEPHVNPDGYTSARVCGKCHTDIYESWKQSLHAFSLTDPIFDTAMMQAVMAAGEEARRVCLRCHAPMVMFNGDYALEEGVTREGVSCDFCHTVTAVHLDGRQRPYDIEPGLVKRSVLQQASSEAHEVAYSPLHATAEFCGGCHNYTTPQGAMVLSTYDEWKKGALSREGVQCQECHMQSSRGRVVRPEVGGSSGEIHLHRLIHDTDQVRSALSVEIVSAQRTSRDFQVEVDVANVGSGHMVPTGIPSREVVLTVTAQGDTFSRSQERRYRKVVADSKGRVLDSDYEVLLYGAKILNDTRIAPRESRRERFSFNIPREGQVKVLVTLRYRYSPVILKEQPVQIELCRAETYAN